MFGVLYAAEANAEMLAAVAREFSPRIEVCGPREIALDLSGLTRLFGDARTIAEELRRTAADRQLRIRVAIAATRTAARLLVRHRAGLTIVEPGTEAAALAALPIDLLAALVDSEEHPQPPNQERSNQGRSNQGRSNQGRSNQQRSNPTPAHEPGTGNLELGTLRRWGLRTLGDFTALPADAIAARLGQEGVRWQRLARGEDALPLVPAVAEEQFEQALDLEWPIDGLEPLSFVLGRLLEPLSAHLARRDRGAAVLHVRLHLVTRDVHERSLQLPVPMRDARTLRTLALLDLESHPPPAAIDRVVVAVEPTPERVLQFSLLTRPQPSPEQVSTLTARLSALMGEGRCGSPVAVDSWQPGAFALKPFAPADANEQAIDDAHRPVVALRRFRLPVIARVQVEHGKPVRVTTDRRGLDGGRVETCAGPWRTSGAWWADGWDRDEWEVTLGDGATYRVFRGRDDDRWFVDGVVD